MAVAAHTFPLWVAGRRGARPTVVADPAGAVSQADLVRRAQQGDTAAFEVLFHKYQRGVYGMIYHLVRNEPEAVDLTQEVFIRAYRSLSRLERPEAFSTWLYRIAGNLGRNWIRDHTRIRVESLDHAAGEEGEGGGREIPDFSADPALQAQSGARNDLIRQAVLALSPDHRMVVTLHYLQGMSVEEIGRIMGCSSGTIKSRLSRARDVLRRRLVGVVED